jgi:hypothetical protein
MPKKYQKQTILGKRLNGLAGLRTVRLQQLRVNSFCLKHRGLHLYRFLRGAQILAVLHVDTRYTKTQSEP